MLHKKANAGRRSWVENVTSMFVAVFLLTLSAQAKEFGSSGVMLLKTPSSVRGEAMGGAMTAMKVDEAGAMDANPAGLTGRSTGEASLVYYHGWVDDSFGAAHVSRPWGNKMHVGAGLAYYNGGSFDWNSDSGESRSVAAEKDLMLGLTGSWDGKWRDFPYSWGANLKYVSSTLLDSYTAQTLALDVGARMALRAGWQGGVSLRNVGKGMKYMEKTDPLPTQTAVGVAWEKDVTQRLSFTTALDLLRDRKGNWESGLGVEARLGRVLALRGGYRSGIDAGGLSVGMGLSWDRLGLDYSFTPMDTQNSIHRISLSYKFLAAM